MWIACCRPCAPDALRARQKNLSVGHRRPDGQRYRHGPGPPCRCGRRGPAPPRTGLQRSQLTQQVWRS